MNATSTIAKPSFIVKIETSHASNLLYYYFSKKNEKAYSLWTSRRAGALLLAISI
jgi:hypothetical protein